MKAWMIDRIYDLEKEIKSVANVTSHDVKAFICIDIKTLIRIKKLLVTF